jgi:hypothetical protein
LDLTHAKDLANTHALKGNNLRQFVLLWFWTITF